MCTHHDICHWVEALPFLPRHVSHRPIDVPLCAHTFVYFRGKLRVDGLKGEWLVQPGQAEVNHGRLDARYRR